MLGLRTPRDAAPPGAQRRRVTGFHIEGLTCPCGSPDLLLGCPGTPAEVNQVVGLVKPGRSARAWCSIEHAEAEGWPWLKTETPKPRRARR
jgi:hypothetical protein